MAINMKKALEAVQKNELSIRKAAELHGVPKTTLHDRVLGKFKNDGCSGPSKPVQEEEELVNFLYGCARIGYPRTRKQVLTIVQEHLIKKGSSKVVTNGWWQRFSKRHENLSLRTAAPLSLPRAKAMDRDTIDHYFEVLESTMRENGIITKPGQIFNCDETGIPLAPKPPKVIAKRGEKNPSYITGDTKAQLSVLACINAAGRWIPPRLLLLVVRWQIHIMAFLPRDGWMLDYSLAGLPNIFCDTVVRRDQCFCSWMGLHLIIVQR